jgi:uncharacterized membrane protein YfcA
VKKPVHPLTYVGVVILFIYSSQASPRVSYLVLGLILLFGAGSTWLRREKIWKDYKKRYKKSKGIGELLNKPRDIYYTLNVWLVLPLAFIAGLLSLYYAWKLV